MSSVQISLLSTLGDNNTDLLYRVVAIATEIRCSKHSEVFYKLLYILKVKSNTEHAAFGSA